MATLRIEIAIIIVVIISTMLWMEVEAVNEYYEYRAVQQYKRGGQTQRRSKEQVSSMSRTWREGEERIKEKKQRTKCEEGVAYEEVCMRACMYAIHRKTHEQQSPCES